MVEAAAAAGADTLLTGNGADALIDQSPYYLSDLVRSGRLGTAWREACAWGRCNNRSAWTELWQYGLAPWLPALRGRRQGPGTVAPWFRPDFARAHSLGDRARRHLEPSSRSMNLSQVLAMLQGATGDCMSWYAAAPCGLAYLHPFLDPRFVCLCLGIQSRFRQQPGPQQKPLLAQAMRAVLPEPILRRRRKNHYNSLVYQGLVRNLPALEAMVRRAPVEELGILDKDVLLQSLQQAALGLLPGGSLDKQNLTLAWLSWYSRQDEWQHLTTPVTRYLVPVRHNGPGCPSPLSAA
jgi:asparagine synthase (glutamine-hydrolysing)